MKKILDLILTEVEAAFLELGYAPGYGRVTLSNRPDLCDYQCNGALAAAKTYKKKPMDIASQVAGRLEGRDMFCQVQAAMPGFINMQLSPKYLAQYLGQMAQDPKQGCQEAGNPMSIIVDYGGANVAKPLHVGHLRSAIIGECVKRMGRFLGHQVVGDVHLGDWGLQIGLIIEELKSRAPGLPYFQEGFTGECPKEPPFTISQLEEIYPAASARAKEDQEFSQKAHEATLKLQNGFPPYRAIWQQVLKVSVEDLKKNYASLNVSFDLWKGESDAQPYLPRLIQKLEDQGLAHESQGALVVDIGEPEDSKELPPCIIRKSDGAALYATSDLGTLMEREEEYHPDWHIYVVDKRQSLHFTQVFRVAKKAGIVPPKAKLSFLGFGTMNGKDGKPFKTREGGVMRLESLMEAMGQAAYGRIMENASVPQEKAKETARMVGLAALKYGDLSNQASKDYVFDIDRFVAFEGNTGPYILYTIVRIKSILAKCQELKDGGEAGGEILPPASQGEKSLMLQLSRFNDVVEGSFQELAPHKLCQYVYELSNELNRFYQENKIITEEDKSRKASWIKLMGLARDVLTTCIHLLGLEVPERM